MLSLSHHISSLIPGIVIAVIVALLPQTSGFDADAQENAPPAPVVLATVNGVEITADHVERDLARTLKGIRLNPAQQAEARATTLNKLIDQRVAFEFLKKHGVAAGQEEVDLQLGELADELATVEKTIDDYLKQTNQTLDELQFQTAWQISWTRYLEQKLTDDFLESHFQKNQRSLDGTELSVAHLMLRAPQDATQVQMDTLRKTAESIARQIGTTSLTWEEAVAQYSQAPTRDSGGEIGWIKLDGPMPRSFTQAAFKLSAGEISQPVTTRFGVHLIKCLEVKEGRLGWRDVIEDVKQGAARAYFDAIVAKHRPEVTIRK